MEELVRTNDLVLISFLESILDEAGIKHFVADGNMSILEGSLAVIPRRILVDSDQIQKARMLLREAGLEHELRPETGQA
jgi:putative signal transducing protein